MAMTDDSRSDNAFERDKPGTNARTEAETAIEELAQRGGVFVNAVRATSMPMVLTDPTLPGNPIVFANQAFLKLSGYRMDEVLGQQPHFMNGSGTDPKDARRFVEMLRSERDDILETVQYRKDGSSFVATVLLSAFKDEQGHIVNHFMSWLDVTRRVDAEVQVAELKAIQEALNASEAKYRGLFNSIDEGFCVIEVLFDEAGKATDYRFLEVNPAFERQTGLVDAEGRTMRSLAPDHEEHWFERYGRIARTGEPARFEDVAAALGRWYDVYAFRVGPPEANRVAILFNDISQRRQIEQDLLKSNELLRTTFDNSVQILQLFKAVRDERGAIVDFDWLLTNKQWNDRWGSNVGKRLLTENPAVVESGVWEKFLEVMETGEAITHEHYYNHEQFDGWFFQTIAKAEDGILLSTLDITDRKRAEQALRESERLRTAMLDVLPVGLALIDVEGNSVLTNSEWSRYLPTNRIPSRDGERGRRWRSFETDGSPVEPNDFPGARALRGERVHPPMEFLFTGDDGREVWTSVGAVPLRNAEGKVVGAVCFIMNIDAAKRAQEALRDSEERMRLIVESARDYAIFTIDADLRVTRWLPGAQSVFGWTKEEIEGRSADILFTPEDRADGAPQEEAERAQRDGKAPDIRWHLRKDGRRVFIEGQVVPLMEDGRHHGFLKIGQDVTVRRAAEEALRDGQRRQQTLLAELQHRVRNTLAVIRSIVRRTAQSSDSVQDFEQHLDGRLSAFARTQAYVTRDPEGGIDLELIVRDELLAHAADGGPAVSIQGPEVRLSAKQAETIGLAVHELTSNAIKHGALCDEGNTIEVEWSIEGEPAQRKLHFRWIERLRDRKLAPPKRNGFGTELLDRVMRYDIDAEPEIAFKPTGFEYRATFPLAPASAKSLT